MCRYAFKTYKPHYACFDCRKTFKRKLLSDLGENDKSEKREARCPECGGLMANMGLDFEAPRKNQPKEWEHLKTLYSVGIAFHSCGCSGPGYIPNTKEDLVRYLEETKTYYLDQLKFWRSRVEPQTQQEIERDFQKNLFQIGKIPYEARPTSPTRNEEAKQYWMEKVNNIEQKLSLVKR